MTKKGTFRCTCGCGQWRSANTIRAHLQKKRLESGEEAAALAAALADPAPGEVVVVDPLGGSQGDRDDDNDDNDDAASDTAGETGAREAKEMAAGLESACEGASEKSKNMDVSPAAVVASLAMAAADTPVNVKKSLFGVDDDEGGQRDDADEGCPGSTTKAPASPTKRKHCELKAPKSEDDSQSAEEGEKKEAEEEQEEDAPSRTRARKHSESHAPVPVAAE